MHTSDCEVGHCYRLVDVSGRSSRMIDDEYWTISTIEYTDLLTCGMGLKRENERIFFSVLLIAVLFC